MLRSCFCLPAAALIGCSLYSPVAPCGSQRSVSFQDTIPGVSVDLSLTDEEKGPDSYYWDITVGGGKITAVHLHDRNDGRMLHDFTTDDVDPAAGFTVAGSEYYSFTEGIETLFGLVRTGRTYLDVHRNSDPEPELRVDVTPVHFEDWSDYFCG